jgi:hypothetical protein
MSPSNSDTFILRRSGRVGLNARVEPINESLNRSRERTGFFENLRRKRELKALVRSIDRGLGAFGIPKASWYGKADKTLCHLRVARVAPLGDLKEYAENTGDFPHLLAHQSRAGIYVAADFSHPFSVPGAKDGQTIPIGSSVQLQQELAELNEDLRVDETFKLSKMVDFLDATETDIMKFVPPKPTS